MNHNLRPFLLTLFTNSPELARSADDAGIDRIGLDLEVLGKEKRQDKLKSWISDHLEEELSAIREQLHSAKLFVRTNPPHPELKDEIDRFIDQGANVLMLPYFTHHDEAAQFIDYIDGRAEVSLLIETAAAAARIDHIVALPGIHDVHIGLNDLHLSLGLASHFELLVSPLMEHLSEFVRDSGAYWGFGGIGRAYDAHLPIPSDLIYAQYAYLQGRSALVSRVFTHSDQINLDLTAEVANARSRIDHWFGVDREELVQARDELRRLLRPA